MGSPIRYVAVDRFWRKEQKYDFLTENDRVSAIKWQQIVPDSRHTWLTHGLEADFGTLLPLAGKEDRIFVKHSLGISTNRDSVVYGFQPDFVAARAQEFLDLYAAELHRFQRKGRPKDLDSFLDHSSLKWSRNLKRHLRGGDLVEFDLENLRRVLYRPFTQRFLYLSDIAVDEPSHTANYFPKEEKSGPNRMIAVTDLAGRSPFSVLMTSAPADLHLCASSDGFQYFPFHTYSENATDPHENVTDWALNEFRKHFGDETITKWDLFHYVYAVLHHPTYRERYAANLRRELPRVPSVVSRESGVVSQKEAEVASRESRVASQKVFREFVEAGKRLADLHVNYEKQPEYALERIENPKEKLDWRVEKMRLGKDKRSLVYNRFLTLSGIPPEVYEYRLGNRSALEWVVDQYQVTTDKRSGIVNDPNRADDPEYIVRLIGQVVYVSLETVKIVKGLPELVVESKMAAGA